MSEQHDFDQLLARVSPPPGDAQRLVREGISRGRALRRRQQAGTAVAALAVFGVIGAGAAVVPHLGGGSPDRGASVAADPTTTPSMAPASPSTAPNDEPARIGLTAQQVPGTVGDLLGRPGAGALHTEPPYTPVSQDDTLVAHFDWQGTLTTVAIEPSAPNERRQCEASGAGTSCTTDTDGNLQLVWGPTEGDGVTAQGAAVWQHGYMVSVLSYNAADGKDVAPLMAAPPLSKQDLVKVAGSDVWFR